MPLVSILRKASNYVLGGEEEQEVDEGGASGEDNEIMFCKNNVCVHPPTVVRSDYDVLHHPGYLTVASKTFIDQHTNAKRHTLLLTWIPNSTLRKCPATIEKVSLRGEIDEQELCRELSQISEATVTTLSNKNPFASDLMSVSNGYTSDYSETVSVSSSSDKMERDSVLEGDEGEKVDVDGDPEVEEAKKELINELQPLLEGANPSLVAIQLKPPTQVTSVNITIANPTIENADISPSDGLIDNPQLAARFARSLSEESNSLQHWMTPEMLAFRHNLAFPESSATNSPVVQRRMPIILKCRRFSVDLSQMRSLRLFFSDAECTSGQLVIASRESQYKILHFHHGGLDHLAQVLHQWHSVLHNIRLAQEDLTCPYRQFMVCRPEVRKSEMHPEEGNVSKITTDYFYGTLLNKKGQIEDDLLLRKCVFFGGLEKKLRKTVWPFLLQCYSFYSTFEDRATLAEIRRQEYEELTKRRLYSMSPEEHAHFWRTVQCVIEKDVVRTDRGNPFFAGNDNPNIEIMKNILLNYAFYNPNLSQANFRYTQGMSDLLAPVLCEIKNESETFWCFVGLMQRAVFVCQPLDNDIDRNLSYLRELIRIMIPPFHSHLQKFPDASELLFCHRWILLCFKREFTEAVAIRMWEACWSNYLTDYFHLFLCLAIIAVYADDVIAQNLRTDEMLLYFSSLAMYMDGQLILRKARGLLHQFRQLPKIPCTLSTLCKRCGPGMWDSGHHPAIECIGHLDNEHCAFAFD
ncbi:TBC1 domain family member 16 isoform X1 [Lutzomyia longipalpis]|uniref:TBC1 domain family member 16 isoform X1 n=1 Tax=Lutzomyia longipalpis TaxID=7200 RepID=UPI0024846195|nr:TBC1 domain family member 16 isoform X1 [Lutzomyia longipalpis]